MIVSCKTESFLPHCASLEFIFYLCSVILTHREIQTTLCANDHDGHRAHPSSRSSDCGQMAKKQVGGSRHQQGWQEARAEISYGSWQAPSRPFPGNLKSKRWWGDEELRRARGCQKFPTKLKYCKIFYKDFTICKIVKKNCKRFYNCKIFVTNCWLFL